MVKWAENILKAFQITIYVELLGVKNGKDITVIFIYEYGKRTS